jgi:hypothetical protein
MLIIMGYMNKRVPRGHLEPTSSSTELPSFEKHFGKPANFVYRKTIVKKKYDTHRLAIEIRKSRNAYIRMKLRNLKSEKNQRRYDNPVVKLDPALFDQLRYVKYYKRLVFEGLMKLDLKFRVGLIDDLVLRDAICRVIDKRFGYFQKEFRARITKVIKGEISFYTSRMDEEFPETNYVVNAGIYGDVPFQVKVGNDLLQPHDLCELRGRVEDFQQSVDDAVEMLDKLDKDQLHRYEISESITDKIV